jgi:hypothetical protein
LFIVGSVFIGLSISVLFNWLKKVI